MQSSLLELLRCRQSCGKDKHNLLQASCKISFLPLSLYKMRTFRTFLLLLSINPSLTAHESKYYHPRISYRKDVGTLR